MTDADEQPSARRRLQAKVLTVSDSVDAGTREDVTGGAVIARLGDVGFDVIEHRVVADSVEEVANALSYMAYGFNGLIVTTGGTGFAPRDVTPEGTTRILDRPAPGLAEAMRAVNPLGRLSRCTAGIRGAALIVNTPGSTSGALEMLDAVLDVVPHAVELLAGGPAGHPPA
jgi:molybdenum cofactor synthesis domain-containing protein